MNADFIAALALGFASSLHCIGMCGGIHSVVALARKKPASDVLATDQSSAVAVSHVSYTMLNEGSQPLAKMAIGYAFRDWLRLPLFSLGRIISYAFAGLVFGAISFSVVQQAPQLFGWMRILSGCLLILLGLSIGRWWLGVGALERVVSKLWQPLMQSFRSLSDNGSLGIVFVLGLVWGWVPCGAVYTTLVWAVMSGDPVQSALLMFGFGLGTIPALLVAGYSISAMQVFFRSSLLRTILALSLLGYGGWIALTSAGDLLDSSEGSHHHHHHQLIKTEVEGLSKAINAPAAAFCH